MPTKKQTKPKNQKFWGIWSRCKKRFREANMSDEEIEEERQEILRITGATPDSSGRFSMTRLTNDQFSTALDFMETSILGMPNKKRRSRSKIYAINQLGLTDETLNSISIDTFKTAIWQDLSADDLSKLQMTAKRVVAQRKKNN